MIDDIEYKIDFEIICTGLFITVILKNSILSQVKQITIYSYIMRRTGENNAIKIYIFIVLLGFIFAKIIPSMADGGKYRIIPRYEPIAIENRMPFMTSILPDSVCPPLMKSIWKTNSAP